MERKIKKISWSAINPISEKKGFTLIELMLALAILVVAVLGTSSTIINITRNAATARKTTLACHLCQSKLEELKSFGYNAALNSDEYDIDGEGHAGGIFDRSARVNNGSIANTKIIQVTVSWNDFIKTHSVSVSTLIANI